MKTKQYALYEGETCLAFGTINQLAKQFNMKPNTLKRYRYQSHIKRIEARNSKFAKVLVPLNDDRPKPKYTKTQYYIQNITTKEDSGPYSLNDITKKLGISRSRLYQYIDKDKIVACNYRIRSEEVPCKSQYRKKRELGKDDPILQEWDRTCQFIQAHLEDIRYEWEQQLRRKRLHTSRKVT